MKQKENDQKKNKNILLGVLVRTINFSINLWNRILFYAK